MIFFFDIDTQHDFLDSDGALSVPGAETIKPNLKRLLDAAGKRQITTISSRCAHDTDDPEFQIFPPHCIEGTRGAERVFAELPALARHEIAVDAPDDPQAHVEPGHHYIVKKKVFDLFSNAWLDGLLQRGDFKDQPCVVFGVATDYCVRCCALGLAKAGARVRVVEDAVRGVAPETTAQTLAEMRAAGVELIAMAEVSKLIGFEEFEI